MFTVQKASGLVGSTSEAFRALTSAELRSVGGGLTDADWGGGDFGGFGGYDFSGFGAYDGGDAGAYGGEVVYDAGLWSVMRAGAELVGAVSAGIDIYKALGGFMPGVSGPNGNENDNGGTSYGIGVCNTFGCWGGGGSGSTLQISTD